MKSGPLRRRKFLQIAATAASAAAVSCGGGKSPWRSFTAAEAETVAAIADRVVPPDAEPGAGQAGALNYLDRQLGGPLKKYRKAYREGLAALDRLSVAQYGKAFTGLAAADQDSLLSLLESGKAPAAEWKPSQARAFFELVRDHTMQSFYGDPRHGGNREYTSWRMLGVPPASVRGRNLYDLSGEGLASRPGRTKWRSRG